MQALDLRCQLRGERNGRFEKHPALDWPSCRAATVEAEPAHGVNQLAMTVDKICDPEYVIAQIDRDFAPLVSAQQLSLDETGQSVLKVNIHSGLS